VFYQPLKEIIRDTLCTTPFSQGLLQYKYSIGACYEYTYCAIIEDGEMPRSPA